MSAFAKLMSDQREVQSPLIPPELRQQRERYNEIMRRHVRAEDVSLSDMEMVKAVLKRAQVQWGWALRRPASS